MKTYYIKIVFASGKELELVSSLSEEELSTVNSEFTTGIEIGFISSYEAKEIELPNLDLIGFVEDDDEDYSDGEE